MSSSERSEAAWLVPVCWGQRWLGLLAAGERSSGRTGGRLDEATTGKDDAVILDSLDTERMTEKKPLS